MHNDSELKHVLVELFDQFTVLPINPVGPIAEGTQTREADEIENYFRGLRWPDLIPCFKRWDPALSSISYLRADGFAGVLPAYMIASILWMDLLDTGVLIRYLLAPSIKESEPLLPDVNVSLSADQRRAANESRKEMFAELQSRLSAGQRAAVGRALKYIVQHDPGHLESYTSLTRSDMQAEVERLWELEPTHNSNSRRT